MYDPEYHRAYREENKEKIRAYKAAWHARNKDRIAANRPTDQASRVAAVERARAWTATNADRRKEYVKRYTAENAERIAQEHRERYAANKEKRLAQVAAYRAANPEKVKHAIQVAAKAWRQKYPWRAAANVRKRQTAQQQRTPQWLTQDDFWLMEQAYELATLRTRITGIKWHVDHDIPLRGKNVSGLHVPTNLRVVTAKENMAKGNRFIA